MGPYLGVPAALALIVHGAPVSVSPLFLMRDQRFIDLLVSERPLQPAIKFAQERALFAGSMARIRDLPVEGYELDQHFPNWRKKIRNIPNPALARAIDCIDAAWKLLFDDGIRMEREAFAVLQGSPDSMALRRAFFERYPTGVELQPLSTRFGRFED